MSARKVVSRTPVLVTAAGGALGLAFALALLPTAAALEQASPSLPPGAGYVTGTVTDELGRPVAGVFVTTHKMPVTSPPTLTAEERNPGKTDFLGRYRLPIAAEGEYLVAVVVPHHTRGPVDDSCWPPIPDPLGDGYDFAVRTPGFEPVDRLIDPSGRFSFTPLGEHLKPALTPLPLPGRNATLSYVTTYAPNALTVERARRVRALPRQQISGVDIRLRTQRSSTVAGRLIGRDGQGFPTRIDLVGASGVASTTSFPDGAFVLMDVPDGAYSIAVTEISGSCDVGLGNPQRWRSRQETLLPIQAGNDLRIGLGFQLAWPLAGTLQVSETPSSPMLTEGRSSIAGQIVSNNGRAIDRALIRITRLADGHVETAVSDLAGRYLFDALPGGTYALAASRNGFSSVAFGRRHSAEDGTAIKLAFSQRFVANLLMPRAASISGRLLDENGAPPQRAVVAVNGSRGSRVWARVDDDGHYALEPLLPDSYVLSWRLGYSINVGGRASSEFFHPGVADIASSPRFVVVAGQRVADANITLPRGERILPTDSSRPGPPPPPEVTLPVYIRFDGPSPRPSEVLVEAAAVTADDPWRTRPNSGLLTWFRSSRQPREMPRVAVGRYVITKVDAGPGWVGRSASVLGRDALDDPFFVTSSAVPEVEVVVTDRVTTLEGATIGSAGRPTSAATVVVFSREPTYWTPLSRRIRVVRPRSDGSYAISGLPAGEYLVHALLELPPGQRVDEVLLAGLKSRAVPVTLIEDRVTRRDLVVSAASTR